MEEEEGRKKGILNLRDASGPTTKKGRSLGNKQTDRLKSRARLLLQRSRRGHGGGYIFLGHRHRKKWREGMMGRQET